MDGSSENSAGEQLTNPHAFHRTSSPVPESEKSFKTVSDFSDSLYYSEGGLRELDRLNSRIGYLEQQNKVLGLQQKQHSLKIGKLEDDLELAQTQKLELEKENTRLTLALTQSQADKQNQESLQAGLEANNADLQSQLADCKSAKARKLIYANFFQRLNLTYKKLQLNCQCKKKLIMSYKQYLTSVKKSLWNQRMKLEYK